VNDARGVCLGQKPGNAVVALSVEVLRMKITEMGCLGEQRSSLESGVEIVSRLFRLDMDFLGRVEGCRVDTLVLAEALCC
jgi:hypothetical protein